MTLMARVSSGPGPRPVESGAGMSLVTRAHLAAVWLAPWLVPLSLAGQAGGPPPIACGRRLLGGGSKI